MIKANAAIILVQLEHADKAMSVCMCAGAQGRIVASADRRPRRAGRRQRRRQDHAGMTSRLGVLGIQGSGFGLGAAAKPRGIRSRITRQVPDPRP